MAKSSGATTLPSGTVTFLFSDIEGSTALLKELGAAGYGALLERHNSLLREQFSVAGGIEIDRQGDSFFFVFSSAAMGVAAAIGAQRALAAERWPNDAEVRIRMGLHTGEATIADGGYVGFAVHQAARVGDVGHGGQILLSRTTASLVEHDLPGGVELLDLGKTKLRGLDRPESLFQVVADGLPQTFPPLTARANPVAPLSDGPPLLEREAEIAAIRAYVEAGKHGGGRLIAIEGGAGMGKTRLVAEARAAAAAAGFEVLSARGGELEHEFAFGIVRQLFEPLLARSADREELLGGAASLVSTLFDDVRFAERIENGGGGDDVSFPMLHGLYWLAANTALRRPTMLAIDDLHWADAPSLRWLSYVVRRLDDLPLVVVAGLRPPEQSREVELLTELVHDARTALVRPDALSVESVAELGREHFETEPDPAFIAACHNATGGNPLFVRSLLATLAGERVEPTAAEARRVLEIGPEAVSRSVSLRLSRLPSEATALAQAVAVLGDGAELHHAAALADLDRDLAGHTATALARADLLRLETKLEFVHPVVRAAVYDQIVPSDRIGGHRHAAHLLRDAGAPPEHVAAHLLLVPPAADSFVVEGLRAAAKRALRRGAPEAAVEFLSRALAEPPSDPEKRDILIALGRAQRRLDTQAAADAFGRAIELVEEPSRRAEVALDWGRTLMRSSRHLEAIEVYQDAISRLDASDPAGCDLCGQLESELISSSWWEPSALPIANAHLESLRIEDMQPGFGRDVLRAQLAYFKTRIGEDRNGAAELARVSVTPALIEAEESVARYYTGWTLMITGHVDEARRFYDAVIEGARKRGDLVTVGGTLLFRGLLSLESGDLNSAEVDLRQAHEIHAHFRSPMAHAYSTAFMGTMLTHRGLWDEARALFEGAKYPEPIPANAHLFFFLNARGQFRFEQRDFQGALADFTLLGEHMQAMQMGNSTFAPWRSRKALALHALGLRDEALPLALEGADVARNWGNPAVVGEALRILGLVEGGASGEKVLREAVEILAGSYAKLTHARALVDLGSALRRANKRAEAREFLRQGLELAHRAGAGPLAEVAQTELAATGARPRRLVVSGVDALTPSERRVAEMAADNMTNKDIAQALFVTTKTVEVHLSNVYRKLEISSRAKLAAALAGSPEPEAIPA